MSQRTNLWSWLSKALCMPCNRIRSWCVSFHMLTLFFTSQDSIPRKIHLLWCPPVCLIFLNLLNASSSHFGLSCLFLQAVAPVPHLLTNMYILVDLVNFASWYLMRGIDYTSQQRKTIRYILYMCCHFQRSNWNTFSGNNISPSLILLSLYLK